MTHRAYRVALLLLAAAAVIQGLAVLRWMDWPVTRWIGAW